MNKTFILSAAALFLAQSVAIASEPAKAKELAKAAADLAIEGKTDESISLFKKAIDLDPENSRTYFNLANVYRRWKYDYPNAIECYKKAAEFEPKLIEAWNMQGLCYKRLNKAAAAESCFKRALEIDSNNYDSLCNLGYFYFNSERYEDAGAYLDKAAKLPEAEKDSDLAEFREKLKNKLNRK